MRRISEDEKNEIINQQNQLVENGQLSRESLDNQLERGYVRLSSQSIADFKRENGGKSVDLTVRDPNGTSIAGLRCGMSFARFAGYLTEEQTSMDYIKDNIGDFRVSTILDIAHSAIYEQVDLSSYYKTLGSVL